MVVDDILQEHKLRYSLSEWESKFLAFLCYAILPLAVIKLPEKRNSREKGLISFTGLGRVYQD